MDNRRTRTSRFVIATLFAAALALPADGHTAGMEAVVGERAVYLYWGPVDLPAGSTLELHRQRGEAAPQRIARPAALTDLAEARKRLASAPDAFSRAMALPDDFTERLKQNAAMDRGLSLLGAGYALIRGYAHLDDVVEFSGSYLYRLSARGPDGRTTPLAEARVDAGQRTVPPTPAARRGGSADAPEVEWTGTPQVRYVVERAPSGNGPWQQLLSWPQGVARAGDTLAFRDAAALPDGARHFYRVVPLTALETRGTPSAPVEIVMPDRMPPAAPLITLAEARAAAVGITWQPGEEPDLRGFHVYRREVLAGAGADGQPRTGPEQRLTEKPLAVALRTYEDKTPRPGALYQYRMSSLDAAGNESSLSGPVLGRPRDVTPPARVAGLEVKALEGGAVELRWRAVPDDDVYAYRVYHVAGEGEPRFVGQARGDAGQAVPTRFEFRLDERSPLESRFAVAAVDRTENEGPRSELVGIRFPDRTPPSAPIITALRAGDGSIEIAWQPPADADLDRVRVLRGESVERLAPLGEVPAGSATFADRKVEAGRAYHYAVEAIDRAGNASALSGVRTAVAYRVSAPAVPTGLRAEANAGRWTLAWNAVSGAQGFVVYVGRARDGRFQQLGTLVAQTRIAVPDPEGDAVWYRVQAVAASGAVSELSDALEVRAAERR